MGARSFGEYVKTKRLEQEISLRKFADQLGISPVYMCNIEKNRNPAPSGKVLNRMVKLLLLTEQECRTFFDLAAKSKTTTAISQDLPEYIMERDMVRIALRTAKDMDATDDEWLEFINFLEKNRRKEKEEKNNETQKSAPGIAGGDCPEND